MNKQPKRQFKPVRAYDIKINGLSFALASSKQAYLFWKRRDAQQRAAELDSDYEIEIIPVLISPLPTPKETKKGRKKQQ